MKKKSSQNPNKDFPKIPWITGKMPVVAVIGDAILDEYLQGEVNRISPEAPVPVHHVKATLHRPGGAANAALNIQTLGGQAKLFSIVGIDEAADRLRLMLRDAGIDDQGVLALADRPTIRKTRVTAGIQQLLRVDWEKKIEISQETLEALLQILEESQWDCLLVSDYGKGLLSDSFLKKSMDIALKRHAPIVIDPKRKDFACYSGATLITPNRKEACLALDQESEEELEGEEIARRLMKRYGFENVLVTLGPKGMLLATKVHDHASEQVEILALDALAREVFDVSGAGDTVAAVMSVGLGAGAPLRETVVLANTAAAIAVGKVGTQPVYQEELIKVLAPQSVRPRSGAKIVSDIEIGDILQTKDIEPSERSSKVVFTNGCFDLLHAGHVTYLEAAKGKGDILIVGINSDRSVKKLKGSSRPIINLSDRMKLIAALECVDYVVAFDEDTPEALIGKIRPNVLIKGGDYRIDVESGHKQGIIGSELVRSIGGEVATIPLVPGISSSEIMKRVILSINQSK